MQKKLVVMLLAIVLVISTCCVALVGCAGNKDAGADKDSGNEGKTEVSIETPAQFIAAWLKSESKSCSFREGATFGVDGDKFCRLFVEEDSQELNYAEVVGDNVYSYKLKAYIRDGEWVKNWFTASTPKQDYFEEDAYSMCKMFNEMVEGNIGFEVSDEEFKNNFKLQDGWYVGSGDFADLKFKISAKELIFGNVKYGDSNNQKYVIGYTIEIPQEGKDAFKNNNN